MSKFNGLKDHQRRKEPSREAEDELLSMKMQSRRKVGPLNTSEGSVSIENGDRLHLVPQTTQVIQFLRSDQLIGNMDVNGDLKKKKKLFY